MNLLTDPLPTAVEVCGKCYPIATGFRDWIRFYALLEDREVPDKQRLQIGMMWYTNGHPEDIGAAWQALIDFSMCKDVPKAGISGSGNGTRAPCFSWTYDAPFVIGAFRQVYGIDLTTCDMHWYTFFALFQALPDDTPLKQRMALRQTRPAEIKDKERRKQIVKAQQAISIPHPVLTDEQIGDVFLL